MSNRVFRYSIGEDDVTALLMFSDITEKRIREYIDRHGSTLTGYVEGNYAGLLNFQGREYRFIFAEVPNVDASIISLRADENLPNNTIYGAMEELLVATESKEKEIPDVVVERYERSFKRNIFMLNANRG